MRVDRIKKIVINILALALISSFSYLLIFSGIINNNPDFMLYLSSAVIQSYAALIAIPLTMSAVHLSRMYGSPLIDVLIRESKGIFALYTVIVVISVFNMIVNPVTQEYLFIMLLLQLSVCILPLYPLIERLRNLLAISPPQIMKILGYPAEIQKLIDKDKLFEVNTRLLKGLSLIRSSVMDISLRDHLSETLGLFSKTISAFPWSDKKVEERKLSDGRVQRIDMRLLLSNIIRYLDECIIDPLKLTKILPDPFMFSPLLTELNKAFIKTDFLNSSVFDDYLRKISILVETFVENRKIDALNFLFYSIFWSFKESKKEIPAKVVSRAICLSASSIRKLKANVAEKGEIKSAFLITTQAFDAIKDNPKIFAWLDSESIDAWIYLIEESDRTDLGWILICLPFIECELGRIKEHEHEFIYNRALMNFSRIVSKIKEKLVRNRWITFIHENRLNIMSIEDNTIASVELKNVLKSDEVVKLLQSFIARHLKDLSK